MGNGEVKRGLRVRVAGDGVSIMAGEDEKLLCRGNRNRGQCHWKVRRDCPCLERSGTAIADGEAEEHTVISSNPSLAARCSDVLPWSEKSGFRRYCGLLLMMRLRRTRSRSWIARRMRVGGSILLQSQCRRRDRYGYHSHYQLAPSGRHREAPKTLRP